MTLSTLISWTLSLVLLATNMAAASPAVVAPNQKLSLHSKAGQQLLQHAQVLEPSHHHHHHVRSHGRRNNYQYGYNYDTDDALSNLANLYIQYTGCSSYVAADNNNNNNGNNNNGNNQNDNDNGNNGNDNNGDNDGLYMNNLVLFTLCSSEGCSDCSGQYAANMQEFLDTYTELQMQDQEYQCEYVRERCYCSYNNGNNNNNYDGNGNYQNSYETCLAQCYSNAGLDGCMNEYYGGEEFRLQEYLECSYAFGDDDDDNNNNGDGTSFYIGPYCSDHQYIYLGAFYDQSCTNQAYPSDFESQNYGDGFPYFYDPILSGSECLSCLGAEQDAEEEEQQQDAYGNNQYDQYQNYQQEQNDEPNELCERAAEEAIKCDPDRGLNSGCYFLKTNLPCLDGRSCHDDSSSGGSSTYSFGGEHPKSMSQRYYEMVQKFHRNKRIAISMGVIAGVLMILFLGNCFWHCCFKPCSPEEQRRREPLLNEHQWSAPPKQTNDLS